MATSANWTDLSDTIEAASLVREVQNMYNSMLRVRSTLDRYALMVGGSPAHPGLVAEIDALYSDDQLAEIQACDADAFTIVSAWHIDHPDLLAV